MLYVLESYTLPTQAKHALFVNDEALRWPTSGNARTHALVQT